MRLTSAATAPYFTAKSTQGEVFDLAKPREKLLLLAFFRYASCPLCNLRVRELIKNYPKLQKHLKIVAVFQSPAEKITQYVGTQHSPFLILPDPERKLYKLYSVERSWAGLARSCTFKLAQVYDAVINNKFLPGSVEGEFNRIPADFIINPDNKIITAFYGNDIGDHLPLSEIYSVVQAYETR